MPSYVHILFEILIKSKKKGVQKAEIKLPWSNMHTDASVQKQVDDILQPTSVTVDRGVSDVWLIKEKSTFWVLVFNSSDVETSLQNKTMVFFIRFPQGGSWTSEVEAYYFFSSGSKFYTFSYVAIPKAAQALQKKLCQVPHVYQNGKKVFF